MKEYIQPNLNEIKFALENCLNATTVSDIKNLLNDDSITPVLKELIEGIEFKLSDSTEKERTLKNINLKELNEMFDEE